MKLFGSCQSSLDFSIKNFNVFIAPNGTLVYREKNLQLPGKGTLHELQNYLVCKKPENLGSFLSRFDVILACIK